jgi:RimJ/RimL family protein N-acetyltransferase
MGRRFDQSYRETVVLNDGSVVLLRLLQPEDKALLAAGFARLSSESRYQRFFTGKERLTEAELRYLTNVDGERHFAICAIGPDGQGAGVARIIRLTDEPEVAELAITVVDAMQRRGLGRILTDRLMAAAAERGVKRLRAEILAENRAMLSIVADKVAGRVRNGASVTVDMPVPDAPADEMLKLAARRLLSFRRAYDPQKP